MNLYHNHQHQEDGMKPAKRSKECTYCGVYDIRTPAIKVSERNILIDPYLASDESSTRNRIGFEAAHRHHVLLPPPTLKKGLLLGFNVSAPRRGHEARAVKQGMYVLGT
ncbi:hypothetical protein [Paenibacillus endoradicis]|uniref:hypothetical protein n=1 Tax=Paenibacillus endoradicis TaxID=2972487 RepID=UPI002158EACD|nr:hypothetical protein [Paenibacillus endoradicis]MCR8660754.1 hypothetical protein [Paenibacillus endoradicis]